jgi:RNA polymerase sigma-70 factor (ECF subfamily)
MNKKEIELQQWMSQFQGGDQSALVPLFQSIKKPLFGFLFRMSGDTWLSEDLLQETLMTVFSKADQYNATLPFMPWVYTIARNKFLENCRLEKKIIRFQQKIQPDNTSSDRFDHQSEIRLDVANVLSELSIPVREAFVLKHFQGFSFPEIAEIQEVPLATVKSRVFFAMKKVRSAMKGEQHA